MLASSTPCLLQHRDIKPSNVLLNDQLFPQLGDTGLAKVLHGEGSHRSTTGTGIPGTPGFIDPLLTKGGIPAARLAQLRLDLRDNTPLPEGIYYDGRSYISMDGDRTEEHPSWDVGLEALLNEMNMEVSEANIDGYRLTDTT